MYPVERTLLSFTMTAPTFLLRHVDLVDTRRAISMKYSSVLGLSIVTEKDSSYFTYLWKKPETNLIDIGNPAGREQG